MTDDTRRPSERLRELLLEVAPLLGFTLTMAVSQRVGLALLVAVTVGILAVGYRLLGGRSPWRAVAALVVVGIGTVLVLLSGQAENFFLPVLVTHAAVATTLILLVAIGRPPLGMIFGSLDERGGRWRQCDTRRRAYGMASLVMATPPLIMLSVGIPLYLASEAVILGIAESLNPVLLGIAGVTAWQVHRRRVRGHDCRLAGCGGDTGMRTSPSQG